MALFKQYSFAATGIRSLCWRDDTLIDWVAGGRAFARDGTEHPTRVSYGYRFDAATSSRDGRYAVIYERLGTKGVVLKDGKILREIDRSFYHAEAYEYPVALFHEPGGRLLLAHCPCDYNRIELEDAETGEPLTTSDKRKPSDFFHSRLAASPRGQRLLSAGWIWHPLDAIEIFDVALALTDPCHLDRGSSTPHSGAEEASACWLDDDTIVVGSPADPVGPEELGEADDDGRPFPRGLAVYDIVAKRCLRRFQLTEEPGTILPIGTNHVLSLYHHPKLISLSTTEVLHAWRELPSGIQNSSIMLSLDGDATQPPIAFDPANGRFAIASKDQIQIIEFDLFALNSIQ